MRKIFALLAMLGSVAAYSQSVVGAWSGILKIQSHELRVVFNIAVVADTINVTMDSPDQGAYGIKTDKATFVDSTLTINVKSLNVGYSGKLKADNKIEGVFRQGISMLPLVLTPGIVAKRKREQDPVPPYPYREEHIKFENSTDNVTLAATLTMPSEGSGFTAVVLVSGSGAQNRDEELMNHRPFLVLADYLTRRGIAVLRYDDRGVGESSGNFAKATTLDLARDAHSAVKYLATRPEIANNKIGIIGHSEGGIVAPIVAAENPQDVAFIVMMAGAGVSGDSIIIMQSALISEASGMSKKDIDGARQINRAVFEMIKNSTPRDTIYNYMRRVLPELDEKSLQNQLTSIMSDWFRTFIALQPSEYIEKVKCPVLAINGELDLQVPYNENLEAINRALKSGGNANFKTIALPKLNHLFQECETGLPTQYAQIEQTISPIAMQTIGDWIGEITHKK